MGLNPFAHTKPKLLNRVAPYAPITLNFRVCEAERCSHWREGTAKSTNTTTRTFQRVTKRFVDFSNQSCVAIRSIFWICFHHNWTYLAKGNKGQMTYGPTWHNPDELEGKFFFTILFTNNIFFTSFVDPISFDTCDGFNYYQLCWGRVSAVFPWS